MTSRPRLPEACGVAFKEWAGVCAALAEGRQSLILRKGGIAEGPGGFAPEHAAFWLYPTHVHEAEQGLRAVPDAGFQPAPTAARPADTVAIQSLAVVEWVGLVAEAATLPALQELHAWTEETVLKRFHYRRPGLWVLGVRLFRQPRPTVLTVTADHAGCRTWVPLDPPLSTAELRPVLDEEEHARRMERLRTLVAAGP
jgi:hypothetical protein